jgi:hypothetical protein
MTHSHKVEKIKSQSGFENDGSAYVVVKNISGRNMTIGLPPVLLYPEDEAFSCDDNPDVLSAVKSYKLEIVKTEEAKEKPKKTKIEETKVEKAKEETLTTVADSNGQVSVQLDLPDDSKTLNSDEL